MEDEIRPLLDENGILPAFAKNKYLESKGVVRLNATGQMESVIYEGDYLNMTFKYPALSKEVDECVKRIKYRKVGKAKVVEEIDTESLGPEKTVLIDKQLMENAEYDAIKNHEEITADEIPF